MLNPAVLARLEEYRAQFQAAEPFRHLCIDDFLRAEIAEKLLADFPEFDRQYAKNEFGQVGGKAARRDLARISPAYREFYDHISSPAFLEPVSRLTGIPGLLFDPRMYGGGTHENVHGQELDPHVDFNYDESLTLHRRLNLILYLNKEWKRAWGGAIGLHSNPRRPAEDRVKEFDPLFNRAVIFETSERSWHGFERINLPPERRHDSRKSVSIYLYTKDRPAEEIAPAHRTFYIPRPLPARFAAGHRLDEDDVRTLKALFLRRDGWIEYYQNQELELNRLVDERTRYLRSVLASVRIPLTGYVLQEAGSARGVHADGWVGPEAEVRLRPLEPVTGLTLRGHLPDSFPQGGRLTAALDGVALCSETLRAGLFDIALRLQAPAERPFTLSLGCTHSYNGARAGASRDGRDLAFMLVELRAHH
jgi:hypothetical protein